MDHTSLLRKALFANAAFSSVCGVSLLVAPVAVARRIGFGEPAALWQLGVSLLVFAAFLALTARARRLRAWVAGIFTLMDVDWVVGTVVLLLTRPEVLNTAGKWVALTVADAVAVCAVLQTIGIVRMVRGARRAQDVRDDGGELETPRLLEAA